MPTWPHGYQSRPPRHPGPAVSATARQHFWCRNHLGTKYGRDRPRRRIRPSGRHRQRRHVTGLCGAGRHPGPCRRSSGECDHLQRFSPGRCSWDRPAACRCSPAPRPRAVLTASGNGADERARREQGSGVHRVLRTGSDGPRHRLAARGWRAGCIGHGNLSGLAGGTVFVKVRATATATRPHRGLVSGSWRELTSDYLTACHRLTAARDRVVLLWDLQFAGSITGTPKPSAGCAAPTRRTRRRPEPQRDRVLHLQRRSG
jgi:hypothetical protein